MRRLKLLFNIVLIISALFIFANTANSKTLTFAVTSDINYLCDDENNTGAKVLDGFISRMQETKYDFIVFNGDNIKKSKPQHLIAFLKRIRAISTPYYLVMGNNDVHKISGISKPEYLQLVHKYNKNQKAQTSYYFYPAPGIIAIVLDGVSTGMPSNHGVFNKKTLQWLSQVLEKNKNKQAIIFQHVPYYEPVDIPEYEILEKAEYAAVLRRHNNVALIVSGHYGKDYEIKDDYGVTHISVPSLSKEPYYFTEIDFSYDKFPLCKVRNINIRRVLRPAV